MSHTLRTKIDARTYANQSEILDELILQADLTETDRAAICAAASRARSSWSRSTSPRRWSRRWSVSPTA